MKKFLSVLFLFSMLNITYVSTVKASGCDWNNSGQEEISSISFKASGTLKCIDNNPCLFAMNSYDGNNASIVFTGPKNVTNGQIWLKHLDGKFKKMREYGSCYDDGELIIAEVIINGVTFSSSQLSYDTPVWP
jgi:hypothetical protein